MEFKYETYDIDNKMLYLLRIIISSCIISLSDNYAKQIIDYFIKVLTIDNLK
ncbi:MAG: hypothetical protein J7K53_12390 [Bacteroidales bacterium]|nr:hypothetical protein [Bacteroidales bacterium]